MQLYSNANRIQPQPLNSTPEPSPQDVDISNEALTSILSNGVPSTEAMGRRIGLHDAIRTKMEASFGADLSSIQLYESQAVADVGAKAISSGPCIAFAPNQPSLSSIEGQRLLGHELSHVMSQASGRVVGSGFLRDQRLESQADRDGSLAAAGEPVYSDSVVPLSASSIASAAGPMQAAKPSKKELNENNTRALQGDLSRTSRMRPTDVNTLVNQRVLHPAVAAAATPAAVTAAIMTNYGVGTPAMLDPINREAIHRLNIPGSIEAGEEMDKQILRQTMYPITPAQQAVVRQHYQTREDTKRLAQEYDISPINKSTFGTEPSGTKRRVRRLQGHNFPARSQASADSLADASIAQSEKSGDALLRAMFLMQLGKFEQIDTPAGGAPTPVPWNKSMAHAFSHGGRTIFSFAQNTLAPGDTTDDIASAVFNGDLPNTAPNLNRDMLGAAAGMKNRSGATHYLTAENGAPSREKGGFCSALVDSNYQHHGMDVAVGGIGNPGVMGPGVNGAGATPQTIMNDGRSGHLYAGVQSGETGKRGGMLVGLETDSPYRMNQTGHMHTISANQASGTSTGGRKSELAGDKKGGRRVDLSGITNVQTTEHLTNFNQYIAHLRSAEQEIGPRAGETSAQFTARQNRAIAAHRYLVDTLSGQRLGDNELASLMCRFMPRNTQHESRRQQRARHLLTVQQAR